MLDRHKKAFQMLLFLDTLRGSHATGVAYVRSTRAVEVLKQPIPGYDFLEDPRVEKAFRLTDILWIGHNRFKTMGDNNKKNAHPFSVLDKDGDIALVGAHNGTLKNKWDLPEHDNYGTDSEALFNCIYNKGLEPTFQDYVRSDGAWAITYWDNRNDTFNVLRNKERTLYWCMEDDEQTMFWASEKWMLEAALSRHGIKIKDDKIYIFEEEHHYVFEGPAKMRGKINWSKSKPKGGLAGKASGFFQTGTTTGVGYGGGGTTTQTTSELDRLSEEELRHLRELTAKRTREPNIKKKAEITKEIMAVWEKNRQNLRSGGNTKETGTGASSKSNVVIFGKATKSTVSSQPSTKDKLDTITKTFRGAHMTRKELQAVLAFGCSWCEDEELTPESLYGWIDDSHVCCKKCLNDTHDVSKDDVSNVGDEGVSSPSTRILRN